MVEFREEYRGLMSFPRVHAVEENASRCGKPAHDWTVVEGPVNLLVFCGACARASDIEWISSDGVHVRVRNE